MKALVTGGAGFIGSHLVDELIERGFEVVVVDNFSTGLREHVNPKAQLVEGDIRDLPELNLPLDFNFIFHTAALARIQPSIKDPAESADVNVVGTLRVLMHAVACRAKVIFSSSSSVYGVKDELMYPIKESQPTNPQSPYALQKLQCEQYLELFEKLYGLKYVALRYFNVYGERQILTGAYAAVVGIFLDQLKRGVPFTIVGDGEQRRDFTYVKDVVVANLLAAERDTKQRIFNIGSGENWSVEQVADILSVEHKREYIADRPGEARETLADNFAAAEELGWKPTTSLPKWLQSQL